MEKAADAQKGLEEANQLPQTQIKARADANALLAKAVEDLYTELNNAALSAADEKDVQSVYDNFKSHGNTIGRDPFNDLAAQFNRDAKKMYSGFPAGLIGGIKGGAPTLELFQ